MAKMKERQFYCVCCRRKVMAKPEDIKFRMIKNRRTSIGSLKAVCKSCDCGLNKFVKDSKQDSMRRKYRVAKSVGKRKKSSRSRRRRRSGKSKRRRRSGRSRRRRRSGKSKRRRRSGRSRRRRRPSKSKRRRRSRY